MSLASLGLVDLEQSPRLLLEAPLRPTLGQRFRPAGFPDIGPVVYTDSAGVDRLLVESEQSIANHLEATLWEPRQNVLKSDVEGLSYVRVVDDTGAFITSTLLEPHRLDSPRVLKAGAARDKLESELGDDLDRRRLPRALFGLDVASLVHGVFLQSVAGHLRVPRALGGFIEAAGVTAVASGGVKLDHRAARGRGNPVLFHREDFVAESIRAYFSLDLAQIRGYGLERDETDVIILVALYEVAALLESPLRLRSGCDLELAGPVSARPPQAQLPASADVASALAERLPRPGMAVTEVRSPKTRKR
ncbi:MAG: type I-U CRISPR-associated RAMP protein Csb1/Cas7u [Myxococcota bacterium]